MAIPRDNYIGEPQYPDPWTTKMPREGLRDIDEARIISLSPDVCLTPVGSSVVPIPYPVVDFCGHDENYTPSVRFTRKKAMVMRSCTTHVHGDSPGNRKGIQSGTVESICEPIGHADQVRAEGSHVIRHLDRCWMNSRNTQGEAIFVCSTETYDPPLDDDPVKGSLVAQKPILLAFDDSSPEGQRLLREFMAKQAQGGVTQPKTSPSLGGRGSFGRPIPGAGLAGAAIALGEMQKQYYPGGRLWRLRNGLEEQGTFVDPDNPRELQALSNYSENLGGTSFIKRNFFPPMTEDEALNQLKTELAETRKLEAREATEAIIGSTKLATALGQGVRVDTNDDEWPCIVGPYKYVEMICPGEAHHIIPDMVYRIGTAPETQAEKDSTEGRIPQSPTYNQGQAVCLSKGMHRTDEDAVHKSLNPALASLGKNYEPQGTAPLGKIRDETHKAIDQINGLPEKCKRMAKDAADAQVNIKFKQPGRTTIQPPKLPRGERVIDVLKAGTY
jgi:hypothetical protein